MGNRRESNWPARSRRSRRSGIATILMNVIRHRVPCVMASIHRRLLGPGVDMPSVTLPSCGTIIAGNGDVAGALDEGNDQNVTDYAGNHVFQKMPEHHHCACNAGPCHRSW